MNYVDYYISRFLKKKASPFFRSGDAWYPSKDGKFSKDLIKLHLDNKVVLGQKLPEDYTDSFVLDFDYKSGDSREEFCNFIKDITHLIQAPNIMVQSSKSKGIHVWFFIKHSRCDYVKDRVLGSLRGKGIYPTSGRIELFCSNKNLRLPLGSGSFLLNRGFNQINVSKEESIHIIKDYLNDCVVPHIFTATPTYVPSFKSLDSSQLEESCKVDSLLELGLQDSGNLNQSCMTLTRFFFRETDGDVSLTSRLIKDWLMEKHNYNSRTYNEDPKKAFKHIDGMVDNWSSKAGASFSEKRETILPHSLCDLIVTNFSGYNKQKSIFNVISYIYDNSTRKRGFPMPRGLITKEKLINSNNYQEVITLLIDEGYLRLVSKGNSYKGHSSIYRWEGPDLRDEKRYNHLSSFIKDVKLSTSYSKYYRKQILIDLKGV